MEEFDAEIDGKIVKVQMRRPNEGERKGWLKDNLKFDREAAALKKNPEENADNLLALLGKIESLSNTLLVKLCQNGVLKSESDFEKMAHEDAQKMREWLEISMGVKEKDKNFTKA